jgi:hypothetical protein
LGPIWLLSIFFRRQDEIAIADSAGSNLRPHFGLTVLDSLMKQRLSCLLLLFSLAIAGCARFTNMTAFDGVSKIPTMTEPDLDDE